MFVKNNFEADNGCVSCNSHSSPPSAVGAMPMSRRVRKALAVRSALFEAGLAAFDRQPINLVSVLDITEAADVAKGVFYLHFKSKDEYLLALWEHIQQRFLDTLRAASFGKRSARARSDAAVRQFTLLASESPSHGRFWIRMSACFPDEVGPPGDLARLQLQYTTQLAAILAAKAPEKLTPADLRSARTLSSLSWALIADAFITDQPIASVDQAPMRLIAAALKSLDT